MKIWLRIGIGLAGLTVLTSCYDSYPIKQTAIVMGTAIDQVQGLKGYKFTYEILRVGAGGENASSGGDGRSEKNMSKGVYFRVQADNMFEGFRKVILSTKRRPYFNHNRVWIVSEKVARDNIMKPFDPVFRNQMLRLRSYLFVTTDDPEKILTIPVLLESLTAMELAISLDTLRFVGGAAGTAELIDIYRMLSGPVQASFVPVINISQQVDSEITKLVGFAVIRGDRMVGKIEGIEATALSMLRGEIRGGVLKTSGQASNKEIEIELLNEKLKLKTQLKNGKLTANIEILLKGKIANAPLDYNLYEPGVKQKIDNDVESWVKDLVKPVLHKLQKEYRADILNIGLQVYRRQPHAFNKVKDNWEEVFANADINVKVKADIYHTGMIIKSRGSIEPKPGINPYKKFFPKY